MKKGWLKRLLIVVSSTFWGPVYLVIQVLIIISGPVISYIKTGEMFPD